MPKNILFINSRDYNSLESNQGKGHSFSPTNLVILVILLLKSTQNLENCAYDSFINIDLAQFPVTARGGGGRGSVKWGSKGTSAFIRLAQGVVDAIWIDLGALNQCYINTS